MPTPSSCIRAFTLLVAVSSFGCAHPAAIAAPTTPTGAGSLSPSTNIDRHVYRFDFVLASDDGSGTSNTSFTLNLQEHQKGEVVIGRNVPLSPSTAGSAAAAPRQDLGIKLVALFRTMGDDVVLDVTAELSAFDPPSTVRKMVALGSAFGAPGKAALVTTLTDEHRRYNLTVTPTKLH